MEQLCNAEMSDCDAAERCEAGQTVQHGSEVEHRLTVDVVTIGTLMETQRAQKRYEGERVVI